MADEEYGAWKCKERSGGSFPFVCYQLALVVPSTMVQIQPRSNLRARLAPAPAESLTKRLPKENKARMFYHKSTVTGVQEDISFFFPKITYVY